MALDPQIAATLATMAQAGLADGLSVFRTMDAPQARAFMELMRVEAPLFAQRSASTLINDTLVFNFGGHRFGSPENERGGLMDMNRAIVQSSNVYFYTLANEMGVDLIHDQLEPMGFGRRTGIDLAPIDVQDDDATTWLRACVWPEHAARRETLLAAGVDRASTLIITFAETRAAERVLEHVRQLNPKLPVIVRTLDERDIEALRHAGAAEVVPETLEVSMVLASHALRHAGVPTAHVLERFRQTRLVGYRALRGFFHGATDSGDLDDARQPRLHAVALTSGAYALDKRVADLRLDALGCSVSAVRRRGSRNDPTAPLAEGDVVVFLERVVNPGADAAGSDAPFACLGVGACGSFDGCHGQTPYARSDSPERSSRSCKAASTPRMRKRITDRALP